MKHKFLRERSTRRCND